MTFTIKLAEEKEASIVHKIVLEAFEEYRNLEVFFKIACPPLIYNIEISLITRD